MRVVLGSLHLGNKKQRLFFFSLIFFLAILTQSLHGESLPCSKIALFSLRSNWVTTEVWEDSSSSFSSWWIGAVLTGVAVFVGVTVMYSVQVH